MKLPLVIPAVQVMLLVAISDGQNAKLNATIHSSSITLACHYIGKENETAISWRNGSSSHHLILKQGALVPGCEVFTTVNATYDPYRTSYTCDGAGNIYTLKIDPVDTVDDNAVWSCQFFDPVPSDDWAEFTIHLKGTSGVSGGGDHNSHTVIIISTVICFTVVTTLATIIIWRKLKGTRYCIISLARPQEPQEFQFQEEEVELANLHKTAQVELL